MYQFCKASLSTSDLQCAVCLETFWNPRVLACGHTFCRDCISSMRDSPHAKYVCCAECRTCTDIPKSINSLPINWVVRRLIDSAKESRPAPQPPQPKVPTCAKHPVPAILFCKSCLNLFCAKCLKDHANHISDACSVEDSVAAYQQFLAETRQGLSDLKTEYTTELAKWSNMHHRISLYFKEQKKSVLDGLDSVIEELKKKKLDLEKEVSADQARLLGLLTPQVVSFCDSLVHIQTDVHLLRLGSTRLTAGELDWTALAKLMELSKLKRNNAPEKGIAESAVEIDRLLCCDKTRLEELSKSIASQTLKPTAISFPSLPFTLPHVTRGNFTCIGRKSIGEETIFKVQTAGPISWYVPWLVLYFMSRRQATIFPILGYRHPFVRNLEAFLAGTSVCPTGISLAVRVTSTDETKEKTLFAQAKVDFKLFNAKNEMLNESSFQSTYREGQRFGQKDVSKIASVYCTDESEIDMSFLPQVEVTLTILGCWFQSDSSVPSA